MSIPILSPVRLAVLCCAAATLALAQQPTPLLANRSEDALIAVLNSGASIKEKMDACRQLGIVGTRRAVPVLAGLFADDQLSHMARYALETMPDPAASEALRDALGRLQDRQLLGVIDSLGVRRDAKAVKALGDHLKNPEADVAEAAARALGSIGNPAAAKILAKALPQAPAGSRLAFSEGLLRSAEALAAAGDRSEALAAYTVLRETPGLPHQVRAGALRGAIVTDSKKGTALLQESLRSPDYVLFAAANRTALELGSSAITAVLTDELKRLPVERRLLLLQTLGRRGDPAALSTLTAAAQSGDRGVRLAAIRALPELRTTASAKTLSGLVTDQDAEIAQAAQESLAALPGPEIDRAVMTMLDGGDAARQLVALDLVGRRRMTEAMPKLLQTAGSGEAKTRAASLKRLGELGGQPEVPALLELLAAAEKSQDIDAVEQALAAICSRVNPPEAVSPVLLQALRTSQPPQQRALLGVVAGVGGEAALQASREAAASSDAETRSAALRALESWRTADAAPALLELAKAAKDHTDKLICLRGYFRWASSAELPPERRLEMCRDASSLVQQAEEKKLLLGSLGSIKTAEAVPLIAPHLNDATVADEAAAALVNVAAVLLKGDRAAQNAAALIEPLQKAAAGGNPELARRAKRLLDQLPAGAGAKN